MSYSSDDDAEWVPSGSPSGFSFSFSASDKEATASPLTPLLRSVCQRSGPGPCSAGHGLAFHSRIAPSPSRSSRRRSRSFRTSESNGPVPTSPTPPERTAPRSRQNLAGLFEKEAPGATPQTLPTSDYSSEEEDLAATSDAPRSLPEGAGSPRLKAFDGSAWTRSPRTGYTYVDAPTYRNAWTPDRETPMPHMARLPLDAYDDGDISFGGPKRPYGSDDAVAERERGRPGATPRHRLLFFIRLVSILLETVSRPARAFSQLLLERRKGPGVASEPRLQLWDAFRTPGRARAFVPRKEKIQEPDGDAAGPASFVSRLWRRVAFQSLSRDDALRHKKSLAGEASRRSARLRGVRAENVGDLSGPRRGSRKRASPANGSADTEDGAAPARPDRPSEREGARPTWTAALLLAALLFIPLAFSGTSQNPRASAEEDAFFVDPVASVLRLSRNALRFVASVPDRFLKSGAAPVPTGAVVDALLRDPAFAEAVGGLARAASSRGPSRRETEPEQRDEDVLLAEQRHVGRALETLRASLDAKSESGLRALEALERRLAATREAVARRGEEWVREQNRTLNDMREKIEALESTVASLRARALACCDDKTKTEVEEVALKRLASSGMNCEAHWNRSLASVRDALEGVKGDVVAAAGEKIREMRATAFEDGLSRLGRRNLSEASGASGVDREAVEALIRDALAKYDADKTGLFDFALESAGGSVVGTRCTETFSRREAAHTFFGVPLWWPSNGPRAAIQPGVRPGECWAFEGSEGHLVVRLSAPTRPAAFSLEHVPKSMSPTGRLDSAPRDFEVYGFVESDLEPDPVFLGRFSYSADGDPIQFFEVQRPTGQAFRYVELKIVSNHGNVHYTCLYRFRVHGSR